MKETLLDNPAVAPAASQVAPERRPESRRTVLEAGHVERRYWADLWRYRELTAFLAWRDLSVRYKQTVLGVAWAVIRPVLTVAVLVVVFEKVARLPSPGVPYSLLVLSGMLCWQLFAAGVSSASESLLGNSNLISKVYFPRLVIPLSSLAVSLADFVVTLPVLAALMLWHGVAPTWRLALLPALVLWTTLAALGLGLWLCALNVRYRDVRYVLPFVIQFGVYVSPVGYSLAVVPDDYRWLFTLNPLTGLIEGFRWALLGGSPPPPPESLAASLAVTALLLVTGVRYFRRTERSFADVI